MLVINNISNEKYFKPRLFNNNLFVFIILFITANAANIITDFFILWVTIISGLLFITKKNKIDSIFVIVISTFILINFISYFFVNNTSFSFKTFWGFIIKISYPYFILKIVGRDFFKKLEKIIYFFTLLSIPIFIIQLIVPHVFYSLSSLLNFITLDEQKFNGGWYVLLYMFSGWFPDRNAGFMWEPGAFAFMILLGMTIKFSEYNSIRFTKHIIIYVIALLLTFSTMAYLALFVLLFSYLIITKRILFILLILPLIFPLLFKLINADFLLPKFYEYFSSIDNLSAVQNTNYLKGNRFAYFFFALDQFYHWPFGYGIVPSKFMLSYYFSDVNGVGTISKIIMIWGVAGILFFIYSIKRFYSALLSNNNNILVITFTIILIIAFFSNPLEKSPILFTVVFYPFIYKKTNTNEV